MNEYKFIGYVDIDRGTFHKPSDRMMIHDVREVFVREPQVTVLWRSDGWDGVTVIDAVSNGEPVDEWDARHYA